MQQLNDRQKAGLFIVTMLIFMKFILVPWLGWVQERSESIQQLIFSQDKLQQVNEKNQILAQQQQQIEASFQKLEAIWLDKPAHQISVESLQYLESVSQQYGVEVRTKNAGTVQKAGSAEFLPVNFIVSGTAESVLSMLAALENGVPKTVVATGLYSRPNAVSKTMIANLELQILVKGQVQ